MRDILKIPDVAYSKIALPLETILFLRFDFCLQKSRSRAEHPRNFVDLSSSVSMKTTLPCGAFGKFGSLMNNDVEEFYINSISNESQCTSFEVVFWVQKRGLERSPLVQLRYRIRDAVVQNRAPLRSILKTWTKIALQCGAS